MMSQITWKCVVPENIRTPPHPTEGTFALIPYPIGISFSGGACHIPLTPRISVIFYLGWEPP